MGMGLSIYSKKNEEGKSGYHKTSQEGTEVIQAKDNQYRLEWWWRWTEVVR